MSDKPQLLRRERTTPENFFAKAYPEPNTGCWLWGGRLGSEGYGQVLVNGRTMKTHRVSWQYLRGEIPVGMVLDHICRVRSCINPDHLRVVTPRINAIENSRSYSARSAAITLCKHCGRPLTPLRKPRKDRKRACQPCWREKKRLCKMRRRSRASALSQSSTEKPDQ